jgi:hypothetical protein
MQDEYVLRGGLLRSSRMGEDAQQKTNDYEPYICGEVVEVNP